MPAARRRHAVIVAVLGPASVLVLGLVLGLVIPLFGSTAIALAGSPAPTAAAGGDPRSSGQGPGLVGDPLAAIVLVVGIALASLVATLLYVRLTGGPRESRPGN